MTVQGGGQQSPLGQLFVELTTKNEEALSKVLKELHTQTKTLSDGFNKLGKDSAEAGEKTAKSWKLALSVMQGVPTALNLASGQLRGLVTAGFHASQMGEMFGVVWERLSLTVAGLFTPEILGATRALDKLTIKLQAMTPAQRQHVAYQLQAAAAAKATFSAMQMLLPVLGPFGALLGAIAVGGAVSEKGIGGFLKDMQPLASIMRDVGRIMANLLIPAARSLADLLEKLGPAIKAIADSVESLNVKSSKTSGVGTLAGAGVGGMAGGIPGAIGGAMLGNLLESKLPAIGLGIKAMLTGSEELRQKAYEMALGEEKEPTTTPGARGPAAGRGPAALETPEAAYTRIAALTLGATSLQQQQLDELEMARKKLEEIAEGLGKMVQNGPDWLKRMFKRK